MGMFLANHNLYEGRETCPLFNLIRGEFNE